MKKVFICSPYRGDIAGNIEQARRFSRMAAFCGYCPITPHLLYPQFLGDGEPEERILGINLGVELMLICDQVWIFGDKISDGMEYELNFAKEHRIPVRLYDSKMNRIDPDTMKIDDRVDEEYYNAVKDLKFFR